MKTAASARRMQLKQLVHEVLQAWVVANGDGSGKQVRVRARARAKSKK